MLIRVGLKNLLSRGLVLILALAVLVLLTRAVVAEFVAGTLIDSRVDAPAGLLAAAIEYVPNSGRLFSRLADVEFRDTRPNLDNAERNGRRAVGISPGNYKYHLLLADILEARGDRAAAEESAMTALALAPNYADVHWKLANLQLRMGKVEPAIGHLRVVADADPRLVPAILDLAWSFSKQDASALYRVADGNPGTKVVLARFLANKSRTLEAIDILSGLDNDFALASPEISPLIDLFIKNGYPKAALKLSRKFAGLPTDNAIVSNGSFESEITKGQPGQFSWRLKDSAYARIRVDSTAASAGSRSLMVDFTGKDTTRLNDEAQQAVVLDPEVNYRLECYVKSQQLQSPGGPRLAVNDKSGKIIATSGPIPDGTADWTLLALNFTSPATTADDAAVVTISVIRQPHYEYDAPTKGRIWFDNFTIVPVNGK